MLGELNWIFTAITDTIAWNTLPRSLFQKLFRQDLLVASLFRNFLLAERVMRSYDCTPVSQPALPPTHQHPMWKAWDLAVDMSLSQLPDILEQGATYQASSFFEEQLTAFDVWLKYGSETRSPPEQLPIVLQVLLSQAHRLKALDLLGQFLDLGPWAVNLALSVGIFPYVLRLLQSAARELRPLLVSIWAKILAVDTSCQNDLVRESSHKYFLSVLQDDCMMPQHRTWAAFILATIVHGYVEGQKEADNGGLISIALEHLDDAEPVLRQWLAIAMGRVWDHNEAARWKGARNNAHEKLYELLKDPVPEVRAAAVFALGTFINSSEMRSEHAYGQDQSIALQLLNTVSEDGSPLVRQELVVALQYVILAFEPSFVAICRQEEELRRASSQPPKDGSQYHTITSATAKRKHQLLQQPQQLQPSSSSSALDRLGVQNGPGLQANRSSYGNLAVSMNSNRHSVGGTYNKIWNGLILLASDPHPEVAAMAHSITVYIRDKANNGGAGRLLGKTSAASSGSLDAFSSMPSSPSKPSYIQLSSPSNSNRSSMPPEVVQIQSESRAFTVQTIKEEETSVQAKRTARRSGSNGRHPSGGQHRPAESTTSLAAVSAVSAAAATSSGKQDVEMPLLTTEFLPWSARYFNKQLMRHECFDCDCDHESPKHWRKEWLYERNNRVRLEAEKQFELIRKCSSAKVDGSVRAFDATDVLRMPPAVPASSIAFHPYNPKIVVAGQMHIKMWDIETGQPSSSPELRLSAEQKLRQLRTAQITSLDYINAHEDALLLVACDDGTLRLYKDQEEESEPETVAGKKPSLNAIKTTHKLVSAWNGLREIVGYSYRGGLTPVTSGLPVHTAWSQFDMTLGVGGDARYIRLWDAERELKKADLNTGCDSYVSCLRFSSYYAAASTSGIFTAGFGDGSVKLFDIRVKNSRVATFSDLDSPVLECRLQETNYTGHLGQQTIIAGSSDGEIRVFELRSPGTGNLGSLSLGQPISALNIHQRAPLFAAWTNQQVTVNLFKKLRNSSTLTNVQLNTIKYHDEGVLGQRLGPDGCLMFHPHLAQLAVGSKDGAISIKNLGTAI